ncbi:unnamed protein product, partial [marine sediment metagenome]
PNGWACPKDLAVVREDNARLRAENIQLADEIVNLRGKINFDAEELSQLANEIEESREKIAWFDKRCNWYNSEIERLGKDVCTISTDFGNASAEINRLREALEFYADEENYKMQAASGEDEYGAAEPDVFTDSGEIAREALNPEAPSAPSGTTEEKT